LNPNDAGYLNSRGLTYLKLGELDRAVADYDAALQYNSKDANSLYGRGSAKRKKGNGTDGDADIAAAKSLEADIEQKFAQYGIDRAGAE
jgi:tetratricopeptide (TPR) repeat protein